MQVCWSHFLRILLVFTKKRFFEIFFEIFYLFFAIGRDRCLVNRQALCNDGSPGLYYIERPATNNGSFWIIYLEGGGSCNTLQTCAFRNATTPQLMTSNGFPATVNNPGTFESFSRMMHYWIGFCL
jgi:hypothetical protein